MPIVDKFGNPIQYHENFPHDLNIVNIEFGAGRNNFGKREYPSCYLTDLSYPKMLSYFNEYNDENSDYHYLDNICNFYDSSFDRQFQNIILCNPYNYGFKKLWDGKKFFDRAGELLNEQGELHIIGKSSNYWCNKESFDKFSKNEIGTYISKYQFELLSFENLNEEHEINQNYTFYTSELRQRTIPNERLIIKKL
ncbi:hypothetical protein [Chryseobacterium schmidteae]|uniref:hypothetical protein n=1 Tax=Chryseobacterium schmidteae TaxID=2730404 RepID=UPI00158D84DD|nr:hypothetical protein [Chryseobacterium schmidteae]